VPVVLVMVAPVVVTVVADGVSVEVGALVRSGSGVNSTLVAGPDGVPLLCDDFVVARATVASRDDNTTPDTASAISGVRLLTVHQCAA
jgi:hypothetical protein